MEYAYNPTSEPIFKTNDTFLRSRRINAQTAAWKYYSEEKMVLKTMYTSYTYLLSFKKSLNGEPGPLVTTVVQIYINLKIDIIMYHIEIFLKIDILDFILSLNASYKESLKPLQNYKYL